MTAQPCRALQCNDLSAERSQQLPIMSVLDEGKRND